MSASQANADWSHESGSPFKPRSLPPASLILPLKFDLSCATLAASQPSRRDNFERPGFPGVVSFLSQRTPQRRPRTDSALAYTYWTEDKSLRSGSFTDSPHITALPNYGQHPFGQPGGIGGGHHPGRENLQRFQIVYYADRTIVVWDSQQAQLQMRKLSNTEAKALANQRFATCPMCGQTVDLDQFKFESNSYFRVLEEAMRVYNEERAHRSGRSGSPAVVSRSGKAIGMLQAQMIDREVAEPSPAFATVGIVQCDENPFRTSASSNDLLGQQEQNITAGLSNRSAGVHLKNLPADLLVDNYYSKFFSEVKFLGSGSYGQVYMCRHKLDDLVLGEYAVKKIPVGDSKKWLIKVLREVKLRQHLHHNNIVSYQHSWLEMRRANQFCPAVPWLFVLMEYCDGGNLKNFVQKNDRYLDENEIWCLFLDVLDGLKHLHETGILHRDLKPSNILLKTTRCDVRGTKMVHALLSDFGTSEILSAGNTQRTGEGFTGTVVYTAPELFERDNQGRYTSCYDFKSDMWSVGCILHFLSYGYSPFGGEDDTAVDREPKEIEEELLRFARENPASEPGDFPLRPDRAPARTANCMGRLPERSLPLRQCLSALLAQDPQWRPSCAELLRNPFFQQHRESRFPRSQLAAAVTAEGPQSEVANVRSPTSDTPT